MNPILADRVQRSFTRSFETYHKTACQQAWVAERLVRGLRDGGAPDCFQSALELGCGTGHLTQRLCTEFEIGALTINDLSPQADRTANSVGASFFCGDATRVEWPEQPNLIASASMIQWLPDPATLLRRAAGALAPGGWLVFSGFGPEQYSELAQVGSSSKAPGLCRPGQLVAAVQNDLEIVTVGEAVQKAYFDSPRDVLEHLRKTGVNGRAHKIWTKSRLRQFMSEYTRHFGVQAGVPLTYHPIWIIARKRD